MSPPPPNEQHYAFVGGAPRSGTTYVQLLLYASGEFATAQETHLFTAFLGRLDEVWERFEERSKTHRDVGLPTVISRAKFDDILRAAAVTVMSDIAHRKPAARWILEKTPENILVWPLIVRLLPKARFLVVVRDPRAVVASTIAARSWAGEWAHRDVGQIAESWVRSIRAGLALEASHPHVIRIRYERLRAQTPSVLTEILGRFGLKAPPENVRRIVASVSLQALKEKRVEAPWPLAGEPSDFFRKGSGTAWRQELSVAKIALIEEIAQEEMKLLGYEPVIKIGGTASD